MFEAGWIPSAADSWRRPIQGSSEVWRLPRADEPGFEQGDAEFTELLDDLARDLTSQLWSRASDHYEGEGLGPGGGDVLLAGREINRFVSAGEFDLVGLQNAAVSGGQWTRVRQASCG